MRKPHHLHALLREELAGIVHIDLNLASGEFLAVCSYDPSRVRGFARSRSTVVLLW